MPSEPALVLRVRPVSTFFAVTSALASVLPCKVAPDSCAHTMPGPAAVDAIADATNDAIRLPRPLNCFFMCFPSSKSVRRGDLSLQSLNVPCALAYWLAGRPLAGHPDAAAQPSAPAHRRRRAPRAPRPWARSVPPAPPAP